MKEELLRLAELCEGHATRLTKYGFNGFEDMRHGKETLRAFLAEAADAFACAAALRASVKEQNNGG